MVLLGVEPASVGIGGSRPLTHTLVTRGAWRWATVPLPSDHIQVQFLCLILRRGLVIAVTSHAVTQKVYSFPCEGIFLK